MTDCFVHASDLHLDAPLGNLGLLDDERRRQLADRSARAWDNLVQLCIDESASFLVLAGDIFDRAIAEVGVQLRFHRGLQRLCEDDVAVFVCHGNHDPISADFHPIGAPPDNVVRFDPGEPQIHEVTLRESREVVLVSGVSFAAQHETANLAAQFRTLERPANTNDRPHVAVLHANVEGIAGHDPYAPCTFDDLDAAAVDYWALGHIHQRDVWQLPGGGSAAYCGNLQGRSFKPSECKPKGALVVPVEHGRIGEPRFEPCDEVRFVRDDIAVRPQDTIDEIVETLTLEAAKRGSEHAPRAVVWQVRLTGTSNDALRLRKAVESGELADELADELAELLGGGGLCRIEAAVRSAIPRESVLAGDDLRADVLRSLDKWRGEAGQPEVDTRSLRNKLLNGLPSALHSVWEQMLEEHPERLDDVVELAEELLLSIYAESASGAQ